MNAESRLPKLESLSFDGALNWFSGMQAKGLMFHPDDEPADIEAVSTGGKLFSDNEVSEARFVIEELFSVLGDEVYEAAYPVVMNSLGLQLDA